uniref:Uncharacterized protein n=1 Tax=Lepeophtheirus salmonis TaxID=72036 RepID=A0A0K2TS91_LEPSM
MQNIPDVKLPVGKINGGVNVPGKITWNQNNDIVFDNLKNVCEISSLSVMKFYYKRRYCL